MDLLQLGEAQSCLHSRCDFNRHNRHPPQNLRRQLHFRRAQLAPVSAHRLRLPVLRCAATETEQSGSLFLSQQQELEIKNKGDELRRDLQGTCVFLIGMMGCGKTTIGKILADAVGYHFFDSDKLVEQAAGGASVAQIFKESNEEGFRDAESEVLSQLSGMARLVVATGGGAVVRPQNWGYLRHGITVYIDVPLEALAKRVVAAGTEKRPLLNGGSDESATHGQTLTRLTKLYQERGPAYAEADVTVSISKIASDMGVKDTKDLTPSVIALQVLKHIQQLIRSQRTYGKPRYGL